MPDVIHRTTLEFRRSANQVEHPEPTWLHDPDMSRVAGVDSRYWKAPADWSASRGPDAMTQPERDQLDADQVEANRDEQATRFDDLEDILRASLLTILAELNAHAAKTNELLDAIDAATSLADLKGRVGAISDYPQRTAAQLRAGIRSRFGS